MSRLLPVCPWIGCNRYVSSSLREFCLHHTAFIAGVNRHLRPLRPDVIVKTRARKLASAHKRRGKLHQQPCQHCGWHQSEMHHPDYSQPLLIVWLCRQCHSRHHRSS